MNQLLGLIASAPGLLGAWQDGDKAFEDPAPPEVRELAPVEPPDAAAHPGWKRHAEPKPLASKAVTEDWPCFLGPRRDGRSRETHLLRDWPEDGPTLVWSMERGTGYTAPVVQGDRLVYTHRESGEVHVDCLNAETGERYWRVTRPCDYEDRFIKNSGPRSTPVIAGERVYVHYVDNRLECLELATGRVVWERDLAAEFEIPTDFFGVVSSPMVHGSLLIQQLGVPGGPTIAAFDKDTGRLEWGAGTRWAPSCTSPVVATANGVERVFVLAGGDSKPPVGGLVVARTDGRFEFEYPFRSKKYLSVCGASPVIDGNRVFLTDSYGAGTAGVAVKDDGGFEELWKNRHIGMQFSNPIFVDGRLYAIDGTSDRAGAVVCFDPETGEEIGRTDLSWDETYTDDGAEKTKSFSIGEGSLLFADGDVLCLGDNGHLLWLEVTPEKVKVIRRAWLFGANESWTPLVLSRGLLYVCQNNRERFGDEPARLLCYDVRRTGS